VTRRAVLLSYRLGGTDGVSVEAAKWQWALGALGFAVRRVAGAIGDPASDDVVLPWLERDASAPPVPAELETALRGADLVVVENLCSLPLNVQAARAAAAVLNGLPDARVVFHHHDLPWQREQFAGVTDLPPRRPNSLHVTINERSCRELADRGIEAQVVRNAFDLDAPPGARDETRRRFGFGLDDVILLQPTRAIPRKDVPAGLAFAAALAQDLPDSEIRYWLTGPAENGYGPTLDRVIAGAPVPVTIGGAENAAHAYAAADAIVFPSTWEGFGNPVIESVIARRPIAVAHYPVLDELGNLGLELFSVEDPPALAKWLTTPDTAVLEANLAVVRRHFSLADLPGRLEAAFATVGWSEW
jgi:glycosyltransferase involved in cell wall biosynthesis